MIKKIPKDRSSNAARTRGGIVGIKFSQALFIYLFIYLFIFILIRHTTIILRQYIALG